MGGTGIEVYRKSNVPPPAITPSGPVIFCQGDSVILTSSAAAGNQWYRDNQSIAGATASNLIVKTAGAYTATATVGGITSGTSAPVSVTVIPLPAKPVITVDGSNNMVSSATTGNQWYISSTTPINGATAQTYRPATNGLYSVRTTQNGCSSEFSDIFNYTFTGIRNLGGGQYIKVTPNPVNDFFVITYNLSNSNNVTVEVADLNGKVILTKEKINSGNQISLASYSAGIYIIRIKNDKTKLNVLFKVVKL
jgi:hypothetical protein